ncbi:acetyl-CoA carboxylase carboxyltransferase subunit alpha [candidate division WOR-3 bacterium]|uniref:Acetyl-coenzyme A carboxylase carboxyl transferase subunit alpha n=1 Tax=candidate division WOR-3 bacterium TaxID=2052148 RepID=A0A9D5QDU3_UNCW3|nr:acetyl-CoA carboxylase carboxyltransferase subunit alpha [candidate division WOR-3 bacterium]MBD3365412.1 acetyl-CoA carboxylase carboxyltransferase subunit alpha [candidate division WOR-3 bacterium]
MAEFLLDFEKPIVELERRIQELRGLEGVETEISKLQKQVDRLRRKVYSRLTRWQIVQLARHPQRPQTLDLIPYLFTDFTELHGDRCFRDDEALVAGIARFRGRSVVVIGHQMGHDTKERTRRNFAQPYPEGYRKALRIFKLAERFNMPVINLVDTQGAYCGIGAEERGQSEAIAHNLQELSLLRTPIIVVVTGQGGSGGAIAIGMGDRMYMLEYSYYSVISPEGCASILWRDKAEASKAAEVLKFTSKDLLNLGIIDGIINEPPGGAHRDWQLAAKLIEEKVSEALGELEELSIEDLVNKRLEKFRAMGEYKDSS